MQSYLESILKAEILYEDHQNALTDDFDCVDSLAQEITIEDIINDDIGEDIDIVDDDEEKGDE